MREYKKPIDGESFCKWLFKFCVVVMIVSGITGFFWPEKAHADEVYALPVPGYTTLSAVYNTLRPRGLWVPSIKRYIHAAIDIIAPRYAPVRAAAGGEVVECYYKKDWTEYDRKIHPRGNFVIIQLPNGDIHIYCHLQAFYVRGGDLLKRGEFFAQVGDSGDARGCHLHFEARHKDGLPFKTTFMFGINWTLYGGNKIYEYQCAQ